MLTPPAALGTSLKNKTNNKNNKKQTQTLKSPKLRKMALDKLVHKSKKTSYGMIK